MSERTDPFVPAVEVVRGGCLESRHRGAIAVADAAGRLLAQLGDPEAPAFMRSTCKPFQALALIELGVADALGFTDEELALACGSHGGEPGPAVHRPRPRRAR
jgi:L-asparaginase II